MIHEAKVYRFQRGTRNEVTMVQAVCQSLHGRCWAGAEYVQDAPRFHNDTGYVTDREAVAKAQAEADQHNLESYDAR